MTGLLVRLLITMGSMWLASRIVPGMHVDTATTLFWAALLLGIVNALVRPLLVIATIPLTIITLGLFLLVINAGMLALVALGSALVWIAFAHPPEAFGWRLFLLGAGVGAGVGANRLGWRCQ